MLSSIGERSIKNAIVSGKNRTDIELLANFFFSNGVIVSGYSSLFGFHTVLHILTLFRLIQCKRRFRTCQCVLHNTDHHRINSSPVGNTECQLSLGCFYFYFCCSVSQNPNCRVTDVIPSLFNGTGAFHCDVSAF